MIEDAVVQPFITELLFFPTKGSGDSVMLLLAISSAATPAMAGEGESIIASRNLWLFLEAVSGGEPVMAWIVRCCSDSRGQSWNWQQQ